MVNTLSLERWFGGLICLIIFIMPMALQSFIRVDKTDLDLVSIILVIFVGSLLLALRVSPIFAQDFGLTVRIIINQLEGWWTFLLVAWMLVSLFWTNYPSIVFGYWLHNLASLLVALMTAHLIRKNWQPVFLMSLAGSISLQSLTAIGQYIGKRSIGLTWLGELEQYTMDGDTFRSYGLTWHPNILAFFLVMGIFILLAYSVSSRRWYMLFFIMPAFLAIIYSGSRANLASLLLGLGLCCLFLLTRLPWGYKFFLVIAIVIMAMISIQLIPQTLKTRMNVILSETSFLGRLTFAFADTLTILEEKPILGTGGGILVYENPPPKSVAHNALIIVWTELGIPGLLLYLMTIFTFLNRLHPHNRWAEFLLTAGFISLNFTTLFDLQIVIPNIRTLIFWYMGYTWGQFLLRESLHLLDHNTQLAGNHLFQPSSIAATKS